MTFLIDRYVGRLGDGSLYPTDPMEELRMNEILGLSGDFDRAFGPSLYLALKPSAYGLPDDYAQTDEGKEHIRRVRVNFANETLPEFLGYFEKMLAASGGDFFGGAKPSIADCQILPQLTKFQAGYIDHIPTTVLDNHPAITGWIAKMMAIPQIAEWYSKK